MDYENFVRQNKKFGYFVVLDGKIPHLYGRVTAGYGWRELDIEERLNDFFCGLALIVHSRIQLLTDYDSEDFNIGVRMLLSSNIKINAICMGLQELHKQNNVRGFFDDNIRFGLSANFKVVKPWGKKKQN